MAGRDTQASSRRAPPMLTEATNDRPVVPRSCVVRACRFTSVAASDDKARREHARATVAAYHQRELRTLLEHVRDGFAELDAGSIDEFELDDLIHRYKQAAKDLWMFCGTTGAQLLSAADAIAYRQEHGEVIDWWGQRAPVRRLET